ncbi:glucose dehydrogenase [Bradyrhizobium macuxiense]|uniref:Glucose dehydrogenase n=1 Tax=Bradyrhizobium macuxiense TaxID=1755647 RepID=A0A125Q716_9BRAD|nr:c-type cytochrome [Bradyrhizobium macuxiense]KWV49655.1 glucose dehydrogenase [Bradyrhizobium macuxiense]
MPSNERVKINLPSAVLVLAIAAMGAPGVAAAAECQSQDTGITLSPGFCATVFADNLGHVRHLAVSSDNVVYANTWSGRYYHNDTPPPGGFLLALKDTTGSGKADVVKRFGPDKAAGAAGGTGIVLYNGGLYAELNDKIVRYARAAGDVAPAGQARTVLSGLPLTGDHPMHPFIIDAKGNLFVDLGSATNACQANNRMPLSPGHKPCTELETRGGTWRYDANKTGQTFSASERYATGIRNGEGFGIDKAGRLYVTQHGRDQLSQNWPKLYTVDQGVELPAEELLELKQGGDYGWPECYYDQVQNKLVLAPEYGGDGGKTVGACASKQAPVAAFPGHLAPNDLLIYTGTQFPGPYRDGAFIAFHGSWNRAPRDQAGYNVVFQPLSDGKAANHYVVFADGFAGAHMDPGRAAFRPSGLAMGPDGALYIGDDVHGRIWRVTYHGDAATAQVAAAPAPAAASGPGGGAVPPEGTHADAGRTTPDLPVPPGATKDQVALGDRIFHGEASNGTCAGCHGSDAKGTPVGPDLASGVWNFGDGSLAAITKTVTEGVPRPRNYTGAMPPKGGAELSDSDTAAVAAYVWAISHAK